MSEIEIFWSLPKEVVALCDYNNIENFQKDFDAYVINKQQFKNVFLHHIFTHACDTHNVPLTEHLIKTQSPYILLNKKNNEPLSDIIPELSMFLYLGCATSALLHYHENFPIVLSESFISQVIYDFAKKADYKKIDVLLEPQFTAQLNIHPSAYLDCIMNLVKDKNHDALQHIIINHQVSVPEHILNRNTVLKHLFDIKHTYETLQQELPHKPQFITRKKI